MTRSNIPTMPAGGAPNYTKVADVTIEKPKKKLTMGQKLDISVIIGLPALVSAMFGGLLAYAGYCAVNHIWQHWHTVTQTATNVHFISTGQYTHSTTSDVFICVTFAILWLVATVGCAYWAEAWYYDNF